MINKYFDKVFVINLDRSPDRLENISKHLKSKNIIWSRFPAIDGQNISNSDIENEVGFLCRKFCSKSMIGCALSHKNIWKVALQQNLDKVLIMEDDIEFTDNYSQILQDAWKQLPNDWDILLLGCGGLCNKNKYSDFSEFLFNIIQPFKNQKTFNSKNIFIPELPTGFYCYAVSKRGCEKLLNIVEKINYHIDYQVSKNYDDLNIYAINPKIVYLTDTPSTIQQNSFPKSINYVLSNIKDSNKIPYSWYTNLVMFEWLGIPFNLWSIIFIILGMGVNRSIQIQNLIVLVFLLEFVYFDKSLIYNLIYVLIGFTLSKITYK